MKHNTFTDLDLIILDGREYRVAGSDGGGIVLVSREAPHETRSLTRDELSERLGTPGLRFVKGGVSRASAERGLSGLPAYFRDLPEKARTTALWRQIWTEELLACLDAGLVRWNEASVNLVLPAVIAAVEGQIRRRYRREHKRAGRIEIWRTPPCAKSLLTWTRRYRKSGYDIMALVPQTHRCGSSECRMEPGELAEFERLIGAYATPLRPSIDKVCETLHQSFSKLNEARFEQGLPLLQVPSRSTVYRAIKRLDPYETYLQRYGADAANKKFALIEYGVAALRPLERVEIDEWEVDLMTLVSEAGLLGQLTADDIAEFEKLRLVVCVAIDCATRCIVGLTLARSASSEASIKTLDLATTDKTAIATSLGCRAGWHQGGRPETVAADMGAAFVNDDFKMACAGLHTRLINPPGGVAKLRARIERVFGTFAAHFVGRFRGRTHSNPVRRGNYDAQAEACLTDRDLLEAFVTYIVDVYHQRPHSGLLGETPAQCWDRLSAKSGPALPVDAMDRRAIFGTELERSISGRGVRVFGADYACAELREAYKHSQQRKVRLRFDQMDLGWIAVEIGETWYPAYDLSGALSGVSFAQWSAFAKTVAGHNRARAEITAEIYRDGLIRLDALSDAAAKSAQLGRLTLNAAEIDRAEKALNLGLYLLPAAASTAPELNTDWFENGIDVPAMPPDKDYSSESENDVSDPPSHNGWRFESDD